MLRVIRVSGSCAADAHTQFNPARERTASVDHHRHFGPDRAAAANALWEIHAEEYALVPMTARREPFMLAGKVSRSRRD
jgi:hypothetical protein